MNQRGIDYITEDFYESLSFQDGEMPDLETVKELFYENGLLINNSFSKPVIFTVDEYIQSFESQIADGSMLQFMQRELYSETEVFGKVAQRLSVYEYSFTYHETTNAPRGINYIQFILDNDHWRITSMAWADQNENHQIPAEYLK